VLIELFGKFESTKVPSTIGIMLIVKMELKDWFQPKEHQIGNGTAFRKNRRIWL
jgi:hypothetical protein